ncbi:type II secretion system protein [Candidatus Uabimicrobium sp. HlEnr_7]|uniref:type II secretion system protein n=1 Tax=Candidatus Uabimicrobium helgolandensis TaxID=3095367 RepID=UPI0035563DB6
MRININKNGFTLTKLILLLAIIMFSVITVLFLLKQSFKQTVQSSRHIACKNHISYFGRALNLYLLDYGRQVHYPQKNGQGFITVLYHTKIIIDPKKYLCPESGDINTALEIQTAPDLGDTDGPVSYAGRKNANQNIYPGIFRPTEETTTTPIISDDIGQPSNHENGTMMIYLFLDTHMDWVRNKNGKFPFLDVLTN